MYNLIIFDSFFDLADTLGIPKSKDPLKVMDDFP
jgi:hypothetical protein